MAPRGRRGESSEPQAFHQLGVQGRKTGVFLPTTNKVDKDGFQPLEDIFSSPRRESSESPNVDDANDEDDEDEEDEEDGGNDTGSEDMEITNSAGPGPQTILRAQRRSQPSPSETRSPTKRSVPAGRAPTYPGQDSSPNNGSRDATVTRNIDFQAIAKGRGRLNGNLGGRLETSREEEEEEDDDDEVEVAPTYDESARPQNDDEEESEEAPTPSPQPAAGKRKRGRPRTSLPESEPPSEDRRSNTPSGAPQPSVKKSRGRPPKAASKAVATAPQASQTSRGRPPRNSNSSQEAAEPEEEEEEEAPRQTKKQRVNGTAKAAPPAKATLKAAAVAKPRGRPGRKPKVTVPDGDGDAGEQSFMALQKGPPLPKRRGLVSVKRDPDAIVQTRSGRHSYRPLNYWAGDQVIQEVEELDDMFTNDRGFVSMSMKEIKRNAEDEPSGTRRGPRGRGRLKGKSKQLKAVDEEEEPDKWESDPGQVFGEVMGWEPEYETHPPADDEQVPIHEDLIAVSAEAVQTKDIKDATFRFAKTLTMPFMGAGIVDLPPGTEKRPKNSRKMHMVFFVHYGKVTVTVNESEFRISAGGQWFVHRGNYYSITNESKTNARIFFSQACEVPAQATGESPDDTQMG
ncbi:unnamed protein product [Clonostachys rosea]|uniref:Mif2/CENP-C cupin domain-containing protein n=1 Tax=Bionectria ochroleuca TaxID=29856 RepID=A0ABY6UNB1_BIOOC|nr:unnamed protein product [Clonostachys rosea]